MWENYLSLICIYVGPAVAPAAGICAVSYLPDQLRALAMQVPQLKAFQQQK